MCCQTRVKVGIPLGAREVAAAVFAVGQFGPWAQEPSWPWVRHIPEEGTIVLAKFEEGALVINIRPGIHNALDHATRRIAGAVCFEMAWRFAEKVNGEVYQLATVMGCKDGENSARYLARFPEERFSFSNVCPGFQAVMLGESQE